MKLYIYAWIVVLFGYMNYPIYALVGVYGIVAPDQAEWLFLESTTADQHHSTWNLVQNYFMKEW